MHLTIHTCWLALAVLPCLALAQAPTMPSASDPRAAVAPLHYAPVFSDAPPARQIQETPDRLWLEANREVQAGAAPMVHMGQMGHARHPDPAPAAQPPMPMRQPPRQSPPMPPQPGSAADPRQGTGAPHHHHGD